MFTLLRKKVYPIGIDLGSSRLKMIQLNQDDGGLGLLAAASREVPQELRQDAGGMQDWYAKTIKELLSEKPFKGRKAVTCLPARDMLIQHIRMAKMEEEQLKKALPWEVQDKIPFDINRALVRHIVAGEVYEGDQTKLEVIVMAAPRTVVEKQLKMLERAKLEVEQVNVENSALLNSFMYLFDRAEQNPSRILFVDLGLENTKVVISHGSQIVFTRRVSVSAKTYQCAIGKALEISESQSSEVFIQAVSGCAGYDSQACLTATKGHYGTLSHSGSPTAVADTSYETIQSVIQEQSQSLCEELRSCIRYHDLMFSADPVQKVIFLGGLAKSRFLCQSIAQNLRLPAQLGDPLVRLSPASRYGQHSDLIENDCHSEWAVALGLSLGSKNAPKG